MITLYSVAGHSWLYHPVDPGHSALVGLESMPGGDLLVLERRFASVFRPVIFSLRRMRLDPQAISGDAPITDIAHFDSSRGWAIDNFEAVARHEGSRYFMVSDDNESALQKTLLMYFEISDVTAPSPAVDRPVKPATDHRDLIHRSRTLKIVVLHPPVSALTNAASVPRGYTAACGSRVDGKSGRPSPARWRRATPAGRRHTSRSRRPPPRAIAGSRS